MSQSVATRSPAARDRCASSRCSHLPMHNHTSTTTRYLPGDHLQLTWLDPEGNTVDAGDFTVTAHAGGDPDHELWIESPLLRHIGHTQPGDVITFDHAGGTVTVRIDTHTAENRP